MAPQAIETRTRPVDQLTGEERHKQLKSSVGDRPLDRFVYGAHPISGNQVDPVKQIRMPTFSELLDERNFRKMHMAACLRWLGVNVSVYPGIHLMCCTVLMVSVGLQQ